MSTNRRLLTVLAIAGAVLALAVGGTLPAQADPPGVLPGQPPAGLNPTDYYTGVGADAFAELTNNVAAKYDATSPAHQLFSYDAINPVTGAALENIVPKTGCLEQRPNGANGGLNAIKQDHHVDNDVTKPFCIDFVRSSRAKGAADTALTFYAQSRDAVSYATLGTAYAPPSLTTAQLKDIFTCKPSADDWSEVGGQAGPIHPYLPPQTAATYTFFLTAIGGLTPNDVTAGCGTHATNPSVVFDAQQNDGTTLNGDPLGILPYAVTKWAAQVNQPAGAGILDLRGGAGIGLLNGLTPAFTTATVPGDPKSYLVLNPAFTAAGTGSPSFGRVFWNAVRNGAPQDLKDVFSNTGYLCQHSAELLVPFGNTPLSNDTSQSEYCGQPQ
jgi:ABC-type phosphate transport system substrate-binding protein